MANKSSTIVQRLWNYCNVLRDDGLVGAGLVPQCRGFPKLIGFINGKAEYLIQTCPYGLFGANQPLQEFDVFWKTII